MWGRLLKQAILGPLEGTMGGRQVALVRLCGKGARLRIQNQLGLYTAPHCPSSLPLGSFRPFGNWVSGKLTPIVWDVAVFSVVLSI